MLIYEATRALPTVALTLAPALVVLGLGVDPTGALVISQVVLSFGIPFALIPLIHFTARNDVMGALVNRRVTTAVAWVVAGVIVLTAGFSRLERRLVPWTRD